MTTDEKEAETRLLAGKSTCVLCRGNIVYTADTRGVRPLLDFIDNGTKLSGFAAADRVVGKGAALLYVLLGVRSVYAPVMSRPAFDILCAAGISARADTLVAAIRNRAGDGFCPIETAVGEVNDPVAALPMIRQTLARL